MLARITACALLLATSAFAVAAFQEGAMEGAPQMPQPTKEHQELLQGVGTWEGTTTMHIPGMPSEPTPAKEIVEAIGGFWTQAHFKTEVMGMPYHGTGVVGYDAERGKYIGTWCDNMSSFLALMEGEADPSTGHITMRWEAPDMTTGALTPHWFVLEHGENEYTSTFYAGEGEGTKTMVIAMKRKGQRPAEAGAKR
ncbi:MAG TPA: DUF1579 family protein [Planctomycetota bacterium]|nr:DUF1579 family protein [Planctomycetota bacterium]